MITNAAVTSLQQPGVSDKFGSTAYDTAQTVSIDCLVDSIRSSHMQVLQGKLKDAEQVIHIDLDNMPQGVSFKERTRLKTNIAFSGEKYFEVVTLRMVPNAHGLAHMELFVKEVRA